MAWLLNHVNQLLVGLKILSGQCHLPQAVAVVRAEKNATLSVHDASVKI